MTGTLTVRVRPGDQEEQAPSSRWALAGKFLNAAWQALRFGEVQLVLPGRAFDMSGRYDQQR